MTTEDTVIDLFAFWPYHDGALQTVLGSRADRMRADGAVRLTAYGGMWVRPVRLLPVQAGAELMARIDAESRRVHDVIDAAKNEGRARIAAMVSEVGQP
jgi:hypothetical protein